MADQYFYITTTLPYVNAAPHIGFAWEIVLADVIARYQRDLLGKRVFFNTGTDEHGLKIYQQAQRAGLSPQVYVDQQAQLFASLKSALHLSCNSFIRTTDSHHIQAAQQFWLRCAQAGDIYKQTYKIRYCVGCELEKTDSELVDGRCPYHPNRELEILEEENYFFRFSRYQDRLLQLYRCHNFVLPDSKQQEIHNFVAAGLRDFSISRLRSKLPWGIPVPGDDQQVMYVWFDALVNYISCLGWPEDKHQFARFWPGVQIAGKDNLRQQSAMWQAMLMSAGLPVSRQILIHGFFTVEGQKMSKSLGNVVDPFKLIKQYSTAAVRYYLLAELNPFADADFSYTGLVKRYNADLANGLGNLVSRVYRLWRPLGQRRSVPQFSLAQDYRQFMEQYQFHQALAWVWRHYVARLDKYVNDEALWRLAGRQQEQKLNYVVDQLLELAHYLQPFLPQTAAHITHTFTQLPEQDKLHLFPRIQITN